MTQYEPGTVAVATVRGVPNVRVFRNVGGWWSQGEVAGVKGDYAPNMAFDKDVTDVRPLVALDPAAYPNIDFASHLRHTGFFEYADRWASQTPPPKPPEPTGLGAVVEDSKGRRYVRLRNSDFVWPWATGAEHEVRYSDIDAVKVLSEGVTND